LITNKLKQYCDYAEKITDSNWTSFDSSFSVFGYVVYNKNRYNDHGEDDNKISEEFCDVRINMENSLDEQKRIIIHNTDIGFW